MALAGAALVTAIGTSAALVLWTPNDAALEAERKLAGKERTELLQSEAELLDAIDKEEARRDSERPTKKRCPYCREMILINAVKCRHCGELLDDELARERRPREWNPVIAAVLSFLIPGLGQVYKGQVFAGLVWLCLVYLSYAACCFPGIVLHIVCLFDAASGGD